MKIIISLLSIITLTTTIYSQSIKKNYKGKNKFAYTATWENLETNTSFVDVYHMKTRRDFLPRGKQRVIYKYFPNPYIDTNTVFYIDSIFYPNFSKEHVVRQYTKNTNLNITSIFENKKELWFHPARNRMYILFELAPFPEVSRDTTAWKREVITGSNSYGALASSSIKSTYEQETTDNENYIVTATSTSKIGKVEAIYTYSNEFGFTEMEFWFFDKLHLTIEITKL